MTDLTILIKRKKTWIILLAETIIISIISVLLFSSRNPSYYGSKISLCYMYNRNTVALIYALYVISPLFATIVYTDIDEYEGTYRYQLLTKKGNKRVIINKYFTVFISGRMNTLFVFELFFIYQCMAIKPTSFFTTDGFSFITYLYPEHDTVLLHDYIIHNHELFPHLLYLSVSVFAGVCGCLSYSLSKVTDNSVVSYIGGFIIPFIISFVLGIFQGKSQILAYYNLFQIITDTSRASVIFNIFGFVGWIIFIFILCFIFELVHNRRDLL